MARSRKSLHTPVTAQGRHGTLYRYTVRYVDPVDPGFPPQYWSAWAYDQEHAVDRFFDACDGFLPEAVARQREHNGAITLGRWYRIV